MAANRVFYDTDSLIVLAVHPAEQPIDATAYPGGKSVSSLIADAEEVPGPTIAVREPVLGQDGKPVLGQDGLPLQGRPVDYQPRRLTRDWIAAHVAPVQESVDGTKGKLALLDADKLDAFSAAAGAITDAKAKAAATLKFNAPTWSRSDPLWDTLAASAQMTPAAMDEIWRAAAA